MKKRVCVIGGGISGLCVAYGLKRAGVDVVLFEKNASVGGNIQTEFTEGFLVERGPNSTIASRELLDLIDSLDIRDQIAVPKPNANKRYILRDGNLIALPSKIIGLIQNKAFSVKAKLRLLMEPFIRTKSPDNESVAAFFERRLGKEIVDYAVDPFISGIYAGDPKILSIRHAFPKMYKFEKDHGSILQGALFSRKNATDKLPKGTPRSITFNNGMQTLTDALRDGLGDRIRVNTPVESLRKSFDFGFEIATGSVTESFDAAIICTPASAAARLIESVDNGLACELNKIAYPPLAVVVTGFRKTDVAADPDGFGFLVPGVERRPILGSLWTSSVFENRAPDGYHLFTTFIGGSRRAELVQNSDEELVKLAIDELEHILGVKSDPVFLNVKKWDQAIPQYNVGYETVVDAIETFTEQNPGIFFCSNFYRGISVSDCVKNSIATTADVQASLNRQ